MTPDSILTALGNTRDCWLEEAEALAAPSRRTCPRWIALAACLVLVLSLTVTAEASSGSVSNLLAPLFGNAQTQIVDGIGIPVGVSATADGYTVTADAIIGDRYNVAIVFTLAREDGQPLPEGRLTFRDQEFSAYGSGGGYRTAMSPEKGSSRAQFVWCWCSTGPVIGRYWSTSFSQLEWEGEDGQEQILAEGPWELKFTLRYQDSSVKLPLKNLEVPMPSGSTHIVKKVLLSPVGIYLDMRVKNHQLEKDLGNFQVTLKLKDGTLLPLEGNYGGRFPEGKTAKASYQTMFEEPVPIENIAALILCGQEFPI